MKGEVETVIKTGRQIVQRQQTEQPKELDDRVTALKLLYNQLGSQVRAQITQLDTRDHTSQNQTRIHPVFMCV